MLRPVFLQHKKDRSPHHSTSAVGVQRQVTWLCWSAMKTLGDISPVIGVTCWRAKCRAFALQGSLSDNQLVTRHSFLSRKEEAVLLGIG